MKFAGVGYSNNLARSSDVYRSTRMAGSMGRNLDAASKRRMKLDDALTKFKSAVGAK